MPKVRLTEMPAKTGKSHDTTKFIAQCVNTPSDCPRARTSLGKISLMKTQITAPCPTACEAINTMMLASTTVLPAPTAAACPC